MPRQGRDAIPGAVTLLARRQVPAISRVLKSQRDASARALARTVVPDGYGTSIYPCNARTPHRTTAP
ncbi:hypothetical protein [Streptomyces sp. NPDC059176]|uniref:hypothetical protein n=1 Tax=Streptomyces sp. NPDC059176 TaxID=3346758 RepID=UPI0036C53220